MTREQKEKHLKELQKYNEMAEGDENAIDELNSKLEESMSVIDDYLNSSGKENRAEISIKAKELYESYFNKPYKNRNERT